MSTVNSTTHRGLEMATTFGATGAVRLPSEFTHGLRKNLSIEMQQLRHFCAVADHGQFAAAARAISMTQPALSRSIRNLEYALGAELFVRSVQGVDLTESGKLFVEHARAIISDVDRARENVGALRGVIRGRVCFGLSPNFDTFVIPAVLGDVVQQHAGISVQAVGGCYEDLAIRVRTGELDFSIAVLPTVFGHPELVDERVLPVAYHVFARAEHPLAREAVVSLDAMARCNWIVSDHGAMRMFERMFESAGSGPPNVVMRTTSFPLKRATMRISNIVSIMPDHLMEEELRSGDMVRLNVQSIPELTHAALTYRTNGVLSRAAQAVMERIRTECRLQCGDTGPLSQSQP
jgi:DNA-binding transcriptional LysR family regulator